MPYISKKKGKTVHLLKEKTKPVVMGKKRRKISLLSIPGMNHVQQIAEPESEHKMQMDTSPVKDPNAGKWPGKRGGRGQKEL